MAGKHQNVCRAGSNDFLRLRFQQTRKNPLQFTVNFTVRFLWLEWDVGTKLYPMNKPFLMGCDELDFTNITKFKTFDLLEAIRYLNGKSRGRGAWFITLASTLRKMHYYLTISYIEFVINNCSSAEVGSRIRSLWS